MSGRDETEMCRLPEHRSQHSHSRGCHQHDYADNNYLGERFLHNFAATSPALNQRRFPRLSHLDRPRRTSSEKAAESRYASSRISLANAWPRCLTLPISSTSAVTGVA
jgi:hypothetical protein